MNDFVDLNIVVIPSAEITKTLVNLSSEIAARHKTYFVLNETNVLPHFSLYSARFPKKNVPHITQVVEEVITKTKPFQIVLNKYSEFSGFIFLDAIKNKNLLNLHESIVDELNPLREGLISDNQKTLTGLTEAQQLAIKKYGYVSAKETYMPHISLTALVNPTEFPVIRTHLPNKEFHFTLQTIAITPFAQYGTCPELIKEFHVT